MNEKESPNLNLLLQDVLLLLQAFSLRVFLLSLQAICHLLPFPKLFAQRTNTTLDLTQVGL